MSPKGGPSSGFPLKVRSPPTLSGVAVGWRAELELQFARRDARTVLLRNHHRGPLQVQKALFPEGVETCHVAILHPPGGVAAGDRLCVRAAVGDRSRVLLTTPGATKWYRSEGGWAAQQLRLSVSDGAVLEWLPRESIFFNDSNVAMDLDVDLSMDAKYFGWDILCFGRRASGETWRLGQLRMRTSIRRAGRVLWSESANVNAGSGFGKSSVGLSGFTVCGTFVVAGYDIDSTLLSGCRSVDPKFAESRIGAAARIGVAARIGAASHVGVASQVGAASQIGVTRVPGVLIARYLGDSAEEARCWFTALWSVLRPALSGRAACPPRVWAC